jgi:hypothetical protein
MLKCAALGALRPDRRASRTLQWVGWRKKKLSSPLHRTDSHLGTPKGAVERGVSFATGGMIIGLPTWSNTFTPVTYAVATPRFFIFFHYYEIRTRHMVTF